MRKNGLRATATGLVILALSAGSALAADDCTPAVQSAIDKQRDAYIASYSDLASQNFSRRPGTFAATTCLDNLMTQGGLDIFFKPPSLDNILNMVKNLACEQASQIFDGIMSGSGINGGSLGGGNLLDGVQLGGNLIEMNSPAGNFSVNSSTIKDLLK